MSEKNELNHHRKEKLMTRRSDRTPENLPDLPIPTAVQHLSYPGDVRGSVGLVLGPMIESDSIPAGQYMTVVSETYDPETGVTRLGLTYGDLDLSAGGGA